MSVQMARACGLAACVVVCGHAFGQALAVTNPSFESPALAAGGVGGPSGWSALSGSDWGSFYPTLQSWSFVAPLGNQVLYSNNAVVRQVTSTTVQAGQTYSLQVSFVRRPGFYGATRKIELRGGSVSLGSLSTLPDPPNAGFVDVVLTVTVPGGSLAVGQPLTIELSGSTQTTFDDVRLWLGVPPGACYANCDASTTAPVLGAADFSCFLARYRAGDAYGNCDASTTAPVLGAADFSCFLAKYRAGC